MAEKSIMLPVSFIEEMEELRVRIGAESHSEVIRRGFELLKKLAQEPDAPTEEENET